MAEKDCHRQDGMTKDKGLNWPAACEGRSIVCFVCVLVHLCSDEEQGALFFYGYVID